VNTDRFVGAGLARMEGSIIEQLLRMRAVIGRFNAARGLRTALLYTGGWFVQWHEGPAAAIDRTWEISRSHKTQHHPRVVHRSRGPASLTEPVQIAALLGPDKATDIARELFEIEREQESEALRPADIWRRFAAPPPARFAGESDRSHRAIAVVSEYTESVDLIRVMAERCRVPMHYQRFAGPDPKAGDAGAAYVDLGSWGHRTRVQALSRHALHLSIARLAFARIDCVVLLAGRSAHSAAALYDAAAPLVAARDPAPPFRIVGADGRAHLDAVLDLVNLVRTAPHA